MTAEDENHLQGELSSLAIECKQKNEFNEKDELEALATAIKEVYFQDCKRISIAFCLYTPNR
jgi:hypothetical protein